jgi:hypothetical protein
MSNQLSAASIRRFFFVAVAGVGILGLIPRAVAGDQGATATNPPAANEPNANQTSPSPALPDGFVDKDEDATSGVKTTLVQLTQRAVTKDSYDSFFSGFLSDLAARDKARAQEFKGADQAHLNEVIGQIQTEWRGKYGQDFAVNDANLAFDEHFPIVQGEVSDPGTASNNWPVSAATGQAITASASSEQQQCNTKELTQGRAVAIIRFPAADGLPEMTVSLIHQRMTGWYVVLPTDRNGSQIYNDLSSHLSYISTHQDQWPNDVNAGYRMVARNVAAALYGVSTPSPTASAQ